MPWELNGNAIGAIPAPGAFLGTTDAQPLIVKTTPPTPPGATPQERLRVTPEGRVGVGITDPKAKLVVSGGGAIVNNVAIGTDTTSVSYFNEFETIGAALSEGTLRLQSPNGLAFHTGPTGTTLADNLRMTITPSGEVGVGKAPATNYKLDVAGTINATDLHKNGSALITSQWADVSGGISYAAGNVGIGELGAAREPDYKLDVQGILNADDIYKGGTRLVGSQWEDVTDDGISYGAGNVGVGKAPSTSYKLDVAGTLNATDLHKNGSALISSQWANVSSGISYTAGNVGVGKAPSTSYKLDVAGTLNAADLHKNGSALISSQWANVSSGISYAAGNVGVGPWLTTARLTVSATSVSDEAARAIDARAVGDGTADKYGIWATASGGGRKWAGIFQAITSAGGDQTVGQDCSASGDGTGLKFGIRAYASGGGIKQAGRFEATSPAGVNENTYGGVFYATGEGTGSKYGMYATASGAGTLYAGWFQGKIHATGSLETPARRAFLIDHPLDPENKTLRHNSVESPENLCLYRGKVKLGPNGRESVRMPNYFAALVKEDEATAYLTPVGEEPSPTSYKWNEAHTELTIFGTGGAEVAYLVLADRDDRTIHLFYRPVEEEKGEGNFERGKLLTPEAFDQPLERGVAPLPPQEETRPIQEEIIRADPFPPGPVPTEPVAPEIPAEVQPEGSHE